MKVRILVSVVRSSEYPDYPGSTLQRQIQQNEDRSPLVFRHPDLSSGKCSHHRVRSELIDTQHPHNRASEAS